MGERVRSGLMLTSQNVRMHQHLAHPPVPESPNSLIDSLSDSLVNAFAKVKKPDERFVEMRHGLDGFDEALVGVDRIETRVRTRVQDLSADYDDFAASIQGLSYLESGITEPLNQFETALLDFGEALRLMVRPAHDTYADQRSLRTLSSPSSTIFTRYSSTRARSEACSSSAIRSSSTLKSSALTSRPSRPNEIVSRQAWVHPAKA